MTHAHSEENWMNFQDSCQRKYTHAVFRVKLWVYSSGLNKLDFSNTERSQVELPVLILREGREWKKNLFLTALQGTFLGLKIRGLKQTSFPFLNSHHTQLSVTRLCEWSVKSKRQSIVSSTLNSSRLQNSPREGGGREGGWLSTHHFLDPLSPPPKPPPYSLPPPTTPHPAATSSPKPGRKCHIEPLCQEFEGGGVSVGWGGLFTQSRWHADRQTHTNTNNALVATHKYLTRCNSQHPPPPPNEPRGSLLLSSTIQSDRCPRSCPSASLRTACCQHARTHTHTLRWLRPSASLYTVTSCRRSQLSLRCPYTATKAEIVTGREGEHFRVWASVHLSTRHALEKRLAKEKKKKNAPYVAATFSTNLLSETQRSIKPHLQDPMSANTSAAEHRGKMCARVWRREQSVCVLDEEEGKKYLNVCNRQLACADSLCFLSLCTVKIKKRTEDVHT